MRRERNGLDRTVAQPAATRCTRRFSADYANALANPIRPVSTPWATSLVHGLPATGCDTSLESFGQALFPPLAETAENDTLVQECEPRTESGAIVVSPVADRARGRFRCYSILLTHGCVWSRGSGSLGSARFRESIPRIARTTPLFRLAVKRGSSLPLRDRRLSLLADRVNGTELLRWEQSIDALLAAVSRDDRSTFATKNHGTGTPSLLSVFESGAQLRARCLRS